MAKRRRRKSVNSWKNSKAKKQKTILANSSDATSVDVTVESKKSSSSPKSSAETYKPTNGSSKQNFENPTRMNLRKRQWCPYSIAEDDSDSDSYSDSSLKVKKAVPSNISTNLTLNKTKPTADNIPAPRCNRGFSRPFMMPSLVLDEIENSTLLEIENEQLVKPVIPEANKVDSSEDTSFTEESAKNFSFTVRKGKGRRRLTKKRGCKAKNKVKSISPNSVKIQASKLLPALMQATAGELKEVQICLNRVDEEEMFREILLHYGERLLQSFPQDLFGSDVESEFHSDSESLEMEFEKSQSTTLPRPMKCNYCSRFFTEPKMLEAHESLHVNKTKINQIRNEAGEETSSVRRRKHYSCQICSKKYKLASGLSVHMEKQHPKFATTDIAVDSPASRYKLRQRTSVVKKNSRVEANTGLKPSSSESIFLPNEAIYVQDGAIVYETLKQENLEQETTQEEDSGVDEYLTINCGYSTHEKEAETEVAKLRKVDKLNSQGDVSIDPFMIQNQHLGQKQLEVPFKQLAEGVQFDMTDGIQCDISDMGSLLDLIDGPDPNAGISGYEEKTLTLNYERNDEEEGHYKCEHCSKVLGSKSLLALHCKQSHFARIWKPYICLYPNCSKRFESSQSLQIHRTKAHSRKEDVSEAPLVEEREIELESNSLGVFTNSTEVVSEMEPGDNETSDEPKGEDSEPELTIAVQAHVQPQSTEAAAAFAERNEDLLKGFKYKCKVCGAKFKKLTAFVKHEWDHSEDNTQTQCCPYCPRRFTDRRNYVLHVKAHMNSKAFGEPKNNFIKNSARKSGASRAQRKSVEILLKPLICQHCHLVYFSVATYITHINDDHMNLSTTWKYKCSHPNCKKTMFKHPWNFRVHMASHATNPECSICGASFTCSSHLAKHKRLKHMNEKWAEVLSNTKLPVLSRAARRRKAHATKYEICTACMKKVDSNAHHHICSKGDHTNFHCQLCGEVFDEQVDLKVHLTSHTKHPCRICTKQIYLERMDLHLESHVGETEFDCRLCRRPYICRDSLMKHLKSKIHLVAVRKAKGQNDEETLEEDSPMLLLENKNLELGETPDEEVRSECSRESENDENLTVLDSSAEVSVINEIRTTTRRRTSVESQLSDNSNQGGQNQSWIKKLISKYTVENSSNSTTSNEVETSLRRDSHNLEPRPCSVESGSRLSTSDDSGHSVPKDGSKDNRSEICYICNEICRGIFGLGNHMLRAHNLFLCSTCNHCSSSAHEHELHIRAMHSDSKLYCKICQKLFLNDINMTRHEEGEMHKLRILQLESNKLAEATNSTEKQVEYPLETECDTSCPHKRYTCQICSNTTHTVQRLESHVSQVHSQFLCNICLKLFGSRKGVDAHRKNHVGESPFDCLICMLPFKKRANYNSHIKSRAHLSREAALNKEGTEAPLSIAVSEQVAMDAEMSNEPTVFIIPEPNSEPTSIEFDESEGEGDGLLISLGETEVGVEDEMTNSELLVETEKRETREFQCLLCEEEFIHWTLYDEHLIQGHDVSIFRKVANRLYKVYKSINQNPKVFRCCVCKQIFLDHKLFNRHWIKFHSNVEISNDTQTQNDSPLIPNVATSSTHFLICPTCDIIFQNQDHLSQHSALCGSQASSLSLTSFISTTPGSSSRSPSSDHPQVIDLTMDDLVGLPPVRPIPTYKHNLEGGIVCDADDKNALRRDLFSAQPIIQNVYSLYDHNT